jgi:hypothetical protein
MNSARRYRAEKTLDPAGKGVRLFRKRKVTTLLKDSELCPWNGSIHLIGEDGCYVHVEVPGDDRSGKTKLGQLRCQIEACQIVRHGFI